MQNNLKAAALGKIAIIEDNERKYENREKEMYTFLFVSIGFVITNIAIELAKVLFAIGKVSKEPSTASKQIAR